MKSQTYSLGLALSNKYLEMIIQCQKPEVFSKKVRVLFYKIKKNPNKTSSLSLNTLDP